MTDLLPSEVDHYLAELFTGSDDALGAALENSRAAGLPDIGVTPLQGKLLAVLVQALDARNVLEIGTLGGYSAIWIARALREGGRLTTLEYDAVHVHVARQNLTRAGVGDRVEVRPGSALDTLPALVAEGAGPYDLIFIDADKTLYAEFWEWAVKLSHPGTVIIADNVVRQGAVSRPETCDENARGARRFLDAVAADPRASATVLQTVGAKGHDGWAIAVVQSQPAL